MSYETCTLCGEPFEPVIVCDECSEQIAGSAWIKCSDRMPDHDDEVLVFLINKNGAPGNITSARWVDPYKDLRSSYREDWEVGCWWRGDWSIQMDAVSHWMPLPEPPTE